MLFDVFLFVFFCFLNILFDFLVLNVFGWYDNVFFFRGYLGCGIPAE